MKIKKVRFYNDDVVFFDRNFLSPETQLSKKQGVVVFKHLNKDLAEKREPALKVGTQHKSIADLQLLAKKVVADQQAAREQALASVHAGRRRREDAETGYEDEAGTAADDDVDVHAEIDLSARVGLGLDDEDDMPKAKKPRKGKGRGGGKGTGKGAGASAIKAPSSAAPADLDAVSTSQKNSSKGRKVKEDPWAGLDKDLKEIAEKHSGAGGSSTKALHGLIPDDFLEPTADGRALGSRTRGVQNLADLADLALTFTATLCDIHSAMVFGAVLPQRFVLIALCFRLSETNSPCLCCSYCSCPEPSQRLDP